MIYKDEATQIDNRESYSIDESVAKMLGWMHGNVRVKVPVQDKYGLIPRHLPHLLSLLHPLETHLQMLLDRAGYEYNEAQQDNEIAKLYVEDKNPVDATSVIIASNAIVNEKYNQVTHWKSVTEKALTYKSLIHEELEKNESPKLEIDQPTTEKLGIVHIKLRSLNEWAKQFGVKIIELPEGLVISGKKLQSHKEQVLNTDENIKSTEIQTRVRRIRQRHNALSKVIDPILETMANPSAERVMAELRKLIGTPDNFTITKIIFDGIEWDKGNGNFGVLDHKALAQRIAEWQKLPLA